MTNKKWIPFYFLLLSFLISCQNGKEKASDKNIADSASLNKKKPLSEKSNEELWDIYLNNPCYLPLIKDSNLWEKGYPVGFNHEDLYNDSLSSTNTYRNRYLVGDFNAVLPNNTIRGVQEIYPTLSALPEFKDLDPKLISRLENYVPGNPDSENLKTDLVSILGEKTAQVYLNFLKKIWAYKLIPVRRDFSIENQNVYSAGQSIVMCEACKDTLLMIGRFATSAKRQDIGFKTGANGVKRKYYYEYLPTEQRRKYYAGLYRITSKNWETARSYDSLDIDHDKQLGGGNNRVTFYQGSAELPNFLLLQPDKKYPNAMRSNGIHEVALRELARGMLGTANSIGCLRVSDFGSKFLRWWVPQNCKLFVAYNDTLYHSKIATNESVIKYLPFKNQEEGNAFRHWLNTYKPEAAKILEISETGDYKNGFIIDGYYYFKDEYNSYLKASEKK